jgi:acyl-CoA reductase-like NAD-dependent aldehyde dehydrogenase
MTHLQAGLTGAIFARDRGVIQHATQRLQNAAGNFYVNDKVHVIPFFISYNSSSA